MRERTRKREKESERKREKEREKERGKERKRKREGKRKRETNPTDPSEFYRLLEDVSYLPLTLPVLAALALRYGLTYSHYSRWDGVR